ILTITYGQIYMFPYWAEKTFCIKTPMENLRILAKAPGFRNPFSAFLAGFGMWTMMDSRTFLSVDTIPET
ncbi:MAG: hypothetical protein AAGA86_11740, partial [Bacteroidota bacterium]